MQIKHSLHKRITGERESERDYEKKKISFSHRQRNICINLCGIQKKLMESADLWNSLHCRWSKLHQMLSKQCSTSCKWAEVVLNWCRNLGGNIMTYCNVKRWQYWLIYYQITNFSSILLSFFLSPLLLRYFSTHLCCEISHRLAYLHFHFYHRKVDSSF